MAFLRNALIASLDDQLQSVAPTDIAHTLIDITIVDGQVVLHQKADAAPPQGDRIRLLRQGGTSCGSGSACIGRRSGGLAGLEHVAEAALGLDQRFG